ncbi:MAG: regulatory protein RecX [Cyanobacteria bacterium]|jgi:regulatory protein|nr:regulatory protein RecX [Cyanobacteria bacterium GSL.Bin1]
MNCQTYLLQLLSRREYTQEELRKKALTKGFEETEITETLQHLQEISVQSDAGVAENLILGYQGKYGKRKIKQKSQEKGIRDDLFERMWEQLADQRETEDLSNLKAKVMRKYQLNQFSDLDPKTKRKVCNFLQYRGFNPFQLLQQWQTEEG